MPERIRQFLETVKTDPLISNEEWNLPAGPNAVEWSNGTKIIFKILISCDLCNLSHQLASDLNFSFG